MPTRPHFQRAGRARPQSAGAADRDRLSLRSRFAASSPCPAQFAGYLAPMLVGPEARIADAAAHAGLDLSRIELIDTPDDPSAAAHRAVELVREGRGPRADQGQPDPDDLMRAVAAPGTGLRAERRLSHAYFVDVPGFGRSIPALRCGAEHRAEPRGQARHRAEHDRSRAGLGMPRPQVAVLAAVEGVTPALPATGDAAALAKMAAQGMIRGADRGRSDDCRQRAVHGRGAGQRRRRSRGRPCRRADRPRSGVRIADAAHADRRCAARSPPASCSARKSRSCWPAATTRWRCAWRPACWPRSSLLRKRSTRPATMAGFAVAA